MMKTVWQMDAQGYYVGPVQADQCPLQPGVYLIPAGCVEEPPPEFEMASGQALQWIGEHWHVVEERPVPKLSPVEKLRAFLSANPDVMAMING